MCTSKQKRFVEEYLIDLNATQAAVRAGYSPRTANEQAARFLANPEIQEQIQAAQAERSKRTEITADAVLSEYAKIAFANMDDFAIWAGGTVAVQDSRTIGRDKTSAVESVTETKDGVRIKLHSKIAALDALAKHLGLNAPVDVKVSGSLDVKNIFAELINLQNKENENSE